MAKKSRPTRYVRSRGIRFQPLWGDSGNKKPEALLARVGVGAKRTSIETEHKLSNSRCQALRATVAALAITRAWKPDDRAANSANSSSCPFITHTSKV